MVDYNHLIHKRNQLILKILWVYYVIDMIFYVGLDPTFDNIWPPVGMLVAGFLTILNYKGEKRATFTMYTTVILLYSYFFYLNTAYPYLVNYIFIIFGIFLTGLYQSRVVILFSTVLAIGLYLYFYLTNFEVIFFAISEIDIIYFVLFAILAMVFLLFYTKFTNELWEKATKNEAITKRKLQSIEGYMQSFFDHTNDAIVVFTLDGQIMRMNESFRCLYHVDDETHVKHINHNIARYIETFSKLKQVNGLEFTDVKEDGTTVEVEVTISPVLNEKNRVVALSCIARDISDRKLADQMLVNSEKLKLAGEMAAGIVHEIRNPITVLHGFIQLMDQQNSYDRTYTKIMLDELNRMNTIISEYLILSKPHAQLKFQACEIDTLIKDVVTLFVSEAHLKNITIDTVFFEEGHFIYCESNLLKQVFINFLKNSIEALPNGGVIKIEISAIEDRWCEVTFADNGIGIANDVLEKIGNPFFTTKETGTGLGMMISQKIIEQHKGTFSIESELGKGTRIKVQLPLKQEGGK
ncbi:PAS domain S-box protein [Bacillus timonensis]|nr:PAS domain S-box protein [Bacillus timonensis]